MYWSCSDFSGPRVATARNKPSRQGQGGHMAGQNGSPDAPNADQLGRKPRDIYVRDLRLGRGMEVATRAFR